MRAMVCKQLLIRLIAWLFRAVKQLNGPVDGELFLKYLNERRATSHVKEEKEDSGKIADLSGTYNDRWKVR